MADAAYTGILMSQKLQEVGFAIPTDGKWCKGLWGDEKDIWTLDKDRTYWTHKREWYVAAAYRADMLQEWLLTIPPFSKRATSICVERVLLHVKDTHVTYRVTLTTVSGIHIALGGTLSDAMADGVWGIWKMMHPTKEMR